MFLTGLPRVLKAAGVQYTLRPGWRTRSLHSAGLIEVRAQMWHTTETADSAFANGSNAPTLGYVESGLGYPLYNLLYGRDGRVYVVAAGSAAHAGKGSGFGMPRDRANQYAIGHSFDANQHGHPVTAAQLESAAKVGKALNDDWPGGLRDVMHGEWAPGRRSDPTRVPGGWPALKAAISRGAWDGAKPEKPKPAPKPSGKTWPDVALPSRGTHNTASHNAWVKLLHDVGHLRSTSERLTNGFQRWLYHVGFNPGPVDGHFGPRTTRALQRFLADRGHYKGLIDGDRGPMTVRAEVAYLNSQRQYY